MVLEFILRTQCLIRCVAVLGFKLPCYSPLQAWRGPLSKNGKRPLVFKRPVAANGVVFPGSEGEKVELPCAQCIGCRLERSRQWAMRCLDEASIWPENCFLTLTYSPDKLPKGGSLVLSHFQCFMKRLRQDAVRSNRDLVNNPIRFFHCGEYGEKFGRPHYHALLFNYNFHDRKHFRTTDRGDRLDTSEKLKSLWEYGHSLIGDVSFESAAYVARYVTKKITGDQADEHYVNKVTGEIRTSEYITMSRRPGIGARWYARYKSDVYPRGYKVVRGLKLRPPRYYDSLFSEECPEAFKEIKKERLANARICASDNSIDRLRVKEEVKKAQLSFLRRSYEEAQ